MSTQLTFTGGEYITPDHTTGFGTALSDPAGRLTSMITNQFYFQELGGDIDVIVINVENFLISMFKSFTNQKLMQSFVA